MRDGLLIVSGCEKGEFFETVLNKIAGRGGAKSPQFYDVLEIQPLDMYMHLVDKGLVASRGGDREGAAAASCEIGEKLGKPVIATGNVALSCIRATKFSATLRSTASPDSVR